MGPKNAGDKIDIRNEVGRDMGFGAKDPPNNTFKKKFRKLMSPFYQRHEHKVTGKLHGSSNTLYGYAHGMVLYTRNWHSPHARHFPQPTWEEITTLPPFSLPLSTGCRSPPLRVAKACRNYLNEKITPLLPPGIG